jgi:hypothetical protein
MIARLLASTCRAAANRVRLRGCIRLSSRRYPGLLEKPEYQTPVATPTARVVISHGVRDAGFEPATSCV